jgi:hypothetical protein
MQIFWRTHMLYVDLSLNDEIPRCFDSRFIVDTSKKSEGLSNSDELARQLSIKYEAEVSVLFIDCLDMNGRDANAEIRTPFNYYKANIEFVDFL